MEVNKGADKKLRKERIYYLDYLRILACLLVVLMHSPMSSGNVNGFFLKGLSYITAPSIGLFFMVSGALLLPVKVNYKHFLKHRLSKIVVPTLLWTIIYLSLHDYYSFSAIEIFRKIASIPFSCQGSGVLWFIYTLIGLYFLSPILSAWLEKATKKEVEYVLILWAITLCYPLLELFVTLNTSTTGILYYFGGYGGYFLLGYYLTKYPRSIDFIWALMVSILGMVLCGLSSYYDWPLEFYTVFWYLSIFIVALAVCIWEIVAKVSTKELIRNNFQNSALPIISNLTFGIYLIHIGIMRKFLWKLPVLCNISNYTLQTFLIFGLTVVLSLLVCWLLSQFKIGYWFIGYSKK